MEPFKKWICDVCGKEIKKVEDGYVVWSANEQGQIDRIRILHKNNHIEGERVTGCDYDHSFKMSLPLESFLGDEGKVRLLSLIDPGANFRQDYKEHIADMRLFVDFFRRVQLPYYEEARIYWDKAHADSFFDGNEVWTYLPQTLKTLVERYSSDE